MGILQTEVPILEDDSNLTGSAFLLVASCMPDAYDWVHVNYMQQFLSGKMFCLTLF